MNIKQVNFPPTQYSAGPVKKSQIYLHHTAGNPSGEGVFNWWASNPERVATSFALAVRDQMTDKSFRVSIQADGRTIWASVQVYSKSSDCM